MCRVVMRFECHPEPHKCRQGLVGRTEASVCLPVGPPPRRGLGADRARIPNFERKFGILRPAFALTWCSEAPFHGGLLSRPATLSAVGPWNAPETGAWSRWFSVSRPRILSPAFAVTRYSEAPFYGALQLCQAHSTTIIPLVDGEAGAGIQRTANLACRLARENKSAWVVLGMASREE